MGVSVFPAPSTGITVSDGNAAGWGSTGGPTWTAISTPSVSGVSSFNFNLSGYKYYKLVFSNLGLSGNSSLIFTFNNTTTNIYSYGHYMALNSTVSADGTINANKITPNNNNYNAGINGYAYLENPALSGAHTLEYEISARNTGSPFWTYSKGYGSWDATTAITSLQFSVSGVTCSSGAITLWGGN
jgi:hypothetical protein